MVISCTACLPVALMMVRMIMRVVMQLRSDRRSDFPPPAPPQGDRSYRQGVCDSGNTIGSLPDDLLLEILTRLECTAEAARAGEVCRNWRGLLTELPQLTFFCVRPRLLEAVLAQVTRPRLDLLDITLVPELGAQVSSLLRAAARLMPEKFIIYVLQRHIWEEEEDNDIELPCLDSTSSLTLNLMCFQVFVPPSGKFTALKSLSVKACCIDIGALVPLCPCLRVLRVRDLVRFDTVKVHSELLEELSLEATNNDIRCIDIVAPVLKEVNLEVYITKDFSLSFSAPAVKIIEWDCACLYPSVGLNRMWNLQSIHESKQHGIHVVLLHILCERGLADMEMSFAQFIAKLPVTNFSVMELKLRTEGHAFGPLLLHLLWIRPAIQGLKLVLAGGKVGVSCPVDCPCERYSNWRSETIPLTNLKDVEIKGLQGEDDEVDFLKLVLKSATMLRRLTLRISSGISPSDGGYKKICSIMKEYPEVEYHVCSI